MCKCIKCLVKFLLVLVAITMMIVGIVLTVAGAFVLWGLKLILENSAPIMKELDKMLKNIGVTGSDITMIEFVASNANVIGGVVFGIGIVLLVISILLIVAMCCCSTKILFIVLVVLLSALALGLSVVLGYYAAKPEERIFKPLQSFMQENIINKYKAIDATNSESILVNVLHIRMACCGLSGYKDFESAPDFKKSGTMAGSGTVYTNVKFPISCCNYSEKFEISKADLDSCVNIGTPSRKDVGCWTTIKTMSQQYFNYIYIALGVTIGVLVLVVIVLIIFICCMDKFE